MGWQVGQIEEKERERKSERRTSKKTKGRQGRRRRIVGNGNGENKTTGKKISLFWAAGRKPQFVYLYLNIVFSEPLLVFPVTIDGFHLIRVLELVVVQLVSVR